MSDHSQSSVGVGQRTDLDKPEDTRRGDRELDNEQSNRRSLSRDYYSQDEISRTTTKRSQPSTSSSRGASAYQPAESIRGICENSSYTGFKMSAIGSPILMLGTVGAAILHAQVQASWSLAIAMSAFCVSVIVRLALPVLVFKDISHMKRTLGHYRFRPRRSLYVLFCLIPVPPTSLFIGALYWAHRRLYIHRIIPSRLDS